MELCHNASSGVAFGFEEHQAISILTCIKNITALFLTRTLSSKAFARDFLLSFHWCIDISHETFLIQMCKQGRQWRFLAKWNTYETHTFAMLFFQFLLYSSVNRNRSLALLKLFPLIISSDDLILFLIRIHLFEVSALKKTKKF